MRTGGIRIDQAQSARSGDADGDLCEYYPFLFGADDRFKDTIEKRFDAWNRDVLILDLIEVFPDHGGKNLALAVALRLIQSLGQGVNLVVCQPCPLQFIAYFDDKPEELARLGLHRSAVDRDDATRRLRRYWRRLRFRNLDRKGEVLALSPAWRLPAMRDLCPGLRVAISELLAVSGGSVGSEWRRAWDWRLQYAGEIVGEPRGDSDGAPRGTRPSRRSIGHPGHRTSRSRRPIPWTRALGPSPMCSRNVRARSLRYGQHPLLGIPG
jgi:hypothetical protein